jgi:hypothetical protein
MNYKNGYKVVYEVAADGKRTFYATKSNAYPSEDDVVLASFNDADFAGKTIYEYKGEFYVSTGAVPAYNEDGTPKDEKIKGFDKLFVEDGTEEVTELAEPEVEDEEPVKEPVAEVDETVVEDEEPETDPEDDETEIEE